MKTLQQLKDIAVLEFCDPGDYVDTVTGAFDGEGFFRDHEMARSIAVTVGSIVFWDTHIAAFEIDEQIIVVRDDPQRLTVEVNET